MKNIESGIYKKKIVFSNYDDLQNPYYGGGGAMAIHEIAKRLQIDHDVTVYSSRYPNSRNVRRNGVKYVKIGIASKFPLIDQLTYQVLLPFYVIRNRNFDIWFESFTPPFSTAFLPLFTRKPIVGLVHLLGATDMKRKYHLPFDYIEALGIKTYKYFVVLNSDIEKVIRGINRKAIISVIPNGVNIIPSKSTTTKTKKYLLFIGRIDIYQKGIDLLFKAYKKIENQIVEELLIVGVSNDKQKNILNSQINKLDLGKRVKLIGRVKGERKSKLFANARIMLMPSRYETQPLTLLEAFAYGVPVITFNLSNFSWISSKYCLKIKPFDTSKFAKAIVSLLKNDTKRDFMAKSAKYYSRIFDWEVIHKQYKSFIEHI